MLLRVFSAVSAALFCTVSSVAEAMVVPEAAAEIPSSFSYSSGPDDIRVLKNPATAKLVDGVRIFSRNPVRAQSFDQDASRGITYPSADLRSPSLEELIVIASVDPSRYVGPDGRPSRSKNTGTVFDFDPGPDQALGTIRDLAKALVNRATSADRAGAPAEPDGSEIERTGAYKYFDAILEAELDREFVSAVTEIVSPSITPDGVVALSIFGARDFAFLTSPVTNKIQIVDFSTGTTLTVSQGSGSAPGYSSPEAKRRVEESPQTTPPVGQGKKPLVVRIISTARDVAVHPLTLLSLILVGVFGALYRVVRGAPA